MTEGVLVPIHQVRKGVPLFVGVDVRGHKILVVGPVGAGGLRDGDRHTVIEMVVRALDAGVVAGHLVVACPIRLTAFLQ